MPMTQELQARRNQQRYVAWQTRRWYATCRQDSPPLVLQASRLPRQRFQLDAFDKVMIGLNVALWGGYFALYLRV